MDQQLSASARRVLGRFCRQYLQLHLALDYPDDIFLRSDVFQEAIFTELFEENAIQHPPPKRYQMRVLKELIKRIEESIQDWEEEGLSDNLMAYLSLLMSSSIPSEATSAQQKSYVTYTLSTLTTLTPTPIITFLEARSLVAASGTTGLRTWEAALHFGNYLCANSSLVTGKSILELGAGTGYLSILCAKHLQASHTLITDGSEEVISSLQTNIYLNTLQERHTIAVKQLIWGYPILGTEDPIWNSGRKIDVVLGADLTYYETDIPALLTTFEELFELFPEVKIIIAATVRIEKTFGVLETACDGFGYVIEELDYPIPKVKVQEGPFYEEKVPIKLCLIRRS